jgi:hypothetical protein
MSRVVLEFRKPPQILHDVLRAAKPLNSLVLSLSTMVRGIPLLREANHSFSVRSSERFWPQHIVDNSCVGATGVLRLVGDHSDRDE